MNAYSQIKGGDLANEKVRLQAQASAWWEVEADLLSRVLLTQPTGLLVDLGCGEGTIAHAVAARWPEWKVLALDDHQDILPVSTDPHLTFGHAPAGERLPLKDQSVDALYARFLMQHVQDSSFLLYEICRVLKPNGNLLCLDVDDRGVIFEPSFHELDALYQRAEQNQSSLGGDRHIGAKLPGLMLQAGLKQVDYEIFPITAKDVGLANFFKVALGLKLSLLSEDHALIDRIIKKATECLGFMGVIPVFAVHARNVRELS